MRNWKTANLDLFTNPAGFIAWPYRAIGMLSGNRTDIRRLLEWAELKKAVIDAAMAQQGAEQVGLTDDVGTVSYIFFEAMTQMQADSMSLIASSNFESFKLLSRIFAFFINKFGSFGLNSKASVTAAKA